MEQNGNVSEETQEVAAPATEGEEEQNVAASASSEVDTGEEDAGSAAQQQPMKGNQKADEAAAFAEMRRQLAALQRQNSELQQSKATADRMERFAKAHGYKTWEELENADLKGQLENGITPEALAYLVQREVDARLSSNPILRDAQAVKEQAVVEKAFDEFKQKYSDAGIETIADFAKLPKYDAFLHQVTQGKSYAEAYLITHEDEIIARRVAAAKQAAINAANSKGHLRSQQSGGEADDITVPADTYAWYKSLNENWTDKQIREHYRRSQKE